MKFYSQNQNRIKNGGHDVLTIETHSDGRMMTSREEFDNFNSLYRRYYYGETSNQQ